jgi:uroporphyrinogen III methyltransferase/synthase
MKSEGIVYLVGAGPGDIGLFTLRGSELLRQAEVVVYDGLVNPDLLRLAPATAEIICADKHNRARRVCQEQINRVLLAKARAGKRVVRLKGGDPCMFGRGGEEAEMLAEAGIAFEVVPGVSSFHSVPAYAGIPLTHRRYNSSVTVVTGHGASNSSGNNLDWAQLARVPGTLVVLMGLKNLRQITATLVAGGRSPETPVAVTSQGTTPRQRTVTGTLATITDLAEQTALPTPAVIVIGEVVGLRQKLAWFERPHNGQRRAVSGLCLEAVQHYEELA